MPSTAPALVFREFPDAASAASALAGDVARTLRAALASRAAASLVVSGGRSPIGFFHELRDVPLDWARVTLALADERWVDASSDASNEHLVREHLLQGRAAAARFVGLKSAAASARAALPEREGALRDVLAGADMLVLGMGDDGHIASLFPQAAGLAEAMDLSKPAALVAIDPPHAPHARISLNLPALLNARAASLLIQGAAKRAVLERACAPGASEDLPIGAFARAARVPLNVYWSA